MQSVNRFGIGQQIAYFTAILFYCCAVGCVIALGWLLGDLGGQHPIIGSLGASVIFFIGAGFVLHVIGRANLPNLRFDREDEEPPGA